MKLRPRRRQNVEGEHNQDEDPGPSNSEPIRRSWSRRQVSTVSRSSVSNIEIGPDSGIAYLLEEALRHILGLLTFADVKSARLVNKHWRQVATTLLRRSSKQITLDGRVSECITKMGDGQFPVNRLRVILLNPLEHNFPGICAWVKELTLSVNIDKHKKSPVWLPEDIVTFPTDCVFKDLTHFNLELIQRTDSHSWDRFTDFVRSILEKSPNLLEVNVGYNSAENLVICPVIEDLFPISNSVGTSKLSTINFERVPLGKIDLSKWSILNLKLRKLRLNVSRFSKTNELLEKFLETQSGTLQDLTLRLNQWDSKTPAATFTFPRLENLEQLRVECYCFYAVVTFADIDYARMFPCLKKLDLKDDRASRRDILGNDLLPPTNTMEELIFPWNLYSNMADLTLNPVVTASKVFTGLKKLEIESGHDPVLIQSVYENMPQLEVLTLGYRTYVRTYDDIITGLDCSKFKGVMTTTWIERLQNAERRSMARLQKLKTLTLTHCVFNGRLSISRLSFHVFKKMSSLKCLNLFRGCAATAQRCSEDEGQKQLLEELRANFVVL